MKRLALKFKNHLLSNEDEECTEILTNMTYNEMKTFNKCFSKLFKSYTTMVTFTIDPKRHDVNDKKLLEKIEDYVLQFPHNKKCDVQRADYVREGTDEDHKHTHWHLGLETLEPFLAKTTKYYESLYGHVDISRSYDNNYNNIIEYINKSIPSVNLI